MLKLLTNFHGVKLKPLFLIHGFPHFQLYSTSTQTNNQFVNYLVQILGFSNKQALSASCKLIQSRRGRGTTNPSHFSSIENANSVISYLKSVGLQQSDISTTISRYPQILLCKVDKTLKPKTETFLNFGFSRSDFADIVKINPAIYFVGVNNTIVPAIQTLLQILGSKENVIRMMKTKRAIRLRSVYKTLVPNVALLEGRGVPIDSIRKAIVIAPGSFTRNPRVFEDALVKVERKFGIPRESPSFLSAVRLLTSVKEKTVDSKIQVFKNFGWTEAEIFALLRAVPLCFGFSEAKLKEKLGFLMNELGYDPKFLASRTSLMTCSLRKRTVPRHKVLLVLKEKGLSKTDCSLNTAICLTESKFLKKFVVPFKEVHQVYAEHVGVAVETLVLTSL